MRHSALIIAASVALCAAAPGQTRPEASPTCPIPAAYLTTVPKLLAVQSALKTGKPIDILAVGSASTNAGDGSYPAVMLRTLQAALPDAKFRLTIRGARGDTTAELLPILEQSLAKTHPELVIWQTGTVDAARGVSPDDMRDALEEGARRVTAAGANLILVDPQYSRFLYENTDLTTYEDVLESVAGERPNVVLFPRLQLMRDWTEHGTIDVEAAPPGKRPQAAAIVHACVGKALARFILAGTGR
jgi:acyl-CoA thioesterase-1